MLLYRLAMIRRSGATFELNFNLAMAIITHMVKSSCWLWFGVFSIVHAVAQLLPSLAPAPSFPPPLMHHHHHHRPAHAIAKAPLLSASQPSPDAIPTVPPVSVLPPRSDAIIEPPSPSSNPLPAIAMSPASSPLPPLNSTHGAPLEPAQLAALHSLGIHEGADPCTSPSTHDIVLCDKATPERHIIALHLQLCARDGVLTEEALSSLDTLKALSFVDCPMLPARVPTKLLNSLTSLTCIASLGRTAEVVDAPALPGTWLSKFHNLSELAVEEVHVNASGLLFIISKMRHLKELKFSNTNLTGVLPVNTWPSNLTSLDLAFNSITGHVPTTIGKLTLLTLLDLSQNKLFGRIPNSFSKLKRLQKLSLASNSLSGPIPTSLSSLSSSLVYLDLSNNKLSGSIFEGFNNMRSLRYLDLSHNHFSGPLPFNQTCLNKLNTLKVRGNLGICYDHSSLSSPFLESVPDCDDSGMPIVPSTLSPAQPPEDALPPFGTQIMEGSPSHHHKGPRTIIAAVAITLVVIIVFIVVIVLVSRCRDRKC